MNNVYRYYVYAYIRLENDTPYYIGKGTGNRAYQKTNRSVSVPSNKNKIKFYITNVTEEDALNFEIAYIKLFGRKDKGTGILLNKTDGGKYLPDNISQKHDVSNKGKKYKRKEKHHSEDHKRKISEAMRGKAKTQTAKLAMSKAKLGKQVPLEIRLKISNSLRGNKNALKNSLL